MASFSLAKEEDHKQRLRYTKQKIREMIEARQASGKWAFIYLGANVDAFEEAGSMGISSQNTAGYQNTSRGTRAVYASASSSVSRMRATGLTLAHNLGGDIDEDGTVNKPNNQAGTPIPPQASKTKVWIAPAATGARTPPA